jgi:hypothetical protein
VERVVLRGIVTRDLVARDDEGGHINLNFVGLAESTGGWAAFV